MSDTSPSVDDPATLYLNDFVRFEHPAVDGKRTGRIIGIESQDAVKVQMFNQHGPTEAAYTVDTSTVELHPEGRLAVVDEETHDNTER